MKRLILASALLILAGCSYDGPKKITRLPDGSYIEQPCYIEEKKPIHPGANSGSFILGGNIEFRPEGSIPCNP